MESHTAPLDVGTPDAQVAHLGRPRSISADEAILKAAADLLIEVGYQALCMETVATQAGVSKSTLYRRHKDKQALVTAMILAAAGSSPREIPVPAGSTRQGLEFMLRRAGGAMSQPSWLPILSAMLSEGDRDGGLVDVMRARIFDPNDEMVCQLVEAGITSGELLPTASAEIINELLFGALLVRSVRGKQIDDDWIERLLSGMMAAFGVRSAEPPAQSAAHAPTGEGTRASVPPWD